MKRLDGRRGAFFDLYVTLLIYGDMELAWSEWLETFHTCLVPHGFDQDVAFVAEQCDGFFGKDEPPITDELTVFERRVSRLVTELDLVISPQDVKHIAESVVEVWGSHISLDPEASELLHALRPNYSLALISNFDQPPHVKSLLKRHRLTELFDVVAISGEVGIKKPDPRIFDSVLGSLHLRPPACFYLGDTAEDAICAQAAGLRSITIERSGVGDTSLGLDFVRNESRSVARVPEQWPQTEMIRTLPELLTLVGADL